MIRVIQYKLYIKSIANCSLPDIQGHVLSAYEIIVECIVMFAFAANSQKCLYRQYNRIAAVVKESRDRHIGPIGVGP
jgi:hypothetical protein